MFAFLQDLLIHGTQVAFFDRARPSNGVFLLLVWVFLFGFVLVVGWSFFLLDTPIWTCWTAYWSTLSFDFPMRNHTELCIIRSMAQTLCYDLARAEKAKDGKKILLDYPYGLPGPGCYWCLPPSIVALCGLVALRFAWRVVVLCFCSLCTPWHQRLLPCVGSCTLYTTVCALLQFSVSVQTRERRGSSFSQLGLEPNHTGLTAQSLFFLEESCRVKRSDTQTFSNYFKRVLKLQKRSSSFSK